MTKSRGRPLCAESPAAIGYYDYNISDAINPKSTFANLTDSRTQYPNSDVQETKGIISLRAFQKEHISVKAFPQPEA